MARQPGQTAFVIIDAKAAGAFMPSVFPPIAAASIAELASLLGLPAEALGATVSAFNNAVQPGTVNHAVLDGCRTSGLTPEKSHWAQRIDTPPFLAYPLRPGITFTYLGVRVDEHARVVLRSGEAARNIFAAGEVMAGNILRRGYLAGFGMTIGTVFGRIAGPGGRGACSRLTPPPRTRQMLAVCNACRYCEQFCPVFPAMERRTAFPAADLHYLANLCHNCGECLYACQYAPPHPFGVNLPRALAEVRAESYERYCWPRPLAEAFRRQGGAVALGLTAAFTVLLLRRAQLRQRARAWDRRTSTR